MLVGGDGGTSFGLGAYGLLSYLNMPVTLIYGLLRGMGTFPHMLIPEFGGALLVRPDQIVAWRGTTDAQATAVLAQATARQPQS